MPGLVAFTAWIGLVFATAYGLPLFLLTHYFNLFNFYTTVLAGIAVGLVVLPSFLKVSILGPWFFGALSGVAFYFTMSFCGSKDSASRRELSNLSPSELNKFRTRSYVLFLITVFLLLVPLFLHHIYMFSRSA